MPPTLSNDLLLRALRREPVERTPVWFMRQAGRCLPSYRALRSQHSFLELCRTPELAAQITRLPIDELGVDAAVLFADILLPLEGMGIGFSFDSDRGPVFEQAIRSSDDVEKIRIADPTEETAYVLDAVRASREALDRSVPLIGFSGAPFTLAAYAIEGRTSRSFDQARTFLHAQPDAFEQLVEKMAKTMSLYLQAQIEAGVDAIQIFDSWAGALAPEDFRRFAFEPVQRILQELGSPGGPTPTIYFVLGGSLYLDLLKNSHADALGVDWRIPLDTVRRLDNHRHCLQGNLDPALLAGGDPHTLRRATRTVLESFGPNPGHIFNTGHGILPQTPPANIRTVVDAVREFSVDLHNSSQQVSQP